MATYYAKCQLETNEQREIKKKKTEKEVKKSFTATDIIST